MILSVIHLIEIEIKYTLYNCETSQKIKYVYAIIVKPHFVGLVSIVAIMFSKIGTLYTQKVFFSTLGYYVLKKYNCTFVP